MNVWEKTFSRYILEVCNKLKIMGHGTPDSLSSHLMTNEAIKNIFEDDTEAASIAMITG